MKKLISVSLGTLVLLGAIALGGFNSSAIASAGQRGNNSQRAQYRWRNRRRHHRHHRHWRQGEGRRNRNR